MLCNTSEHVPLSVLLKRESVNKKADRPEIVSGEANQSKKGEDFKLIKSECERLLGDGVTTAYYSIFGGFGSSYLGLRIFDGHNGYAASIYSKENLLNNVLCAIPHHLNRDEWVATLPRALVSGFVKTDKDFQQKAQMSGTTVTFVIIEGSIVTTTSVGDSLCILESADGAIYHLSADHRLDLNKEERERVTASGGEVGRLNTRGGTELSSAGGRLVILSDGVWDALSTEEALECSHGLAPKAVAAQIVKEAVHVKELRDDTTCIVIDILPLEKTYPFARPSKKTGKRVFKAMFRKRSTEEPPKLDDDEDDYFDPDLVEEIVEERSAMLSERLDTKYPLCNVFRLFICAVCQIEIKPGEGISIHHGSGNKRGRLRPWNGPFLGVSCQQKRDAMEGKILSTSKIFIFARILSLLCSSDITK